jgi:hypothetical protein
MKTIITIIALTLATCCSNADVLGSLMTINTGTNYGDSGADTIRISFNKAKTNFIVLATAVDTLATNTSGILASNTWSLFSATNELAPGDARFANSNGLPVVVSLAGGVVGVFNLTATGGGGGTNTTYITNTITAYNFTNQVLASKQIIAYSTNYAYWDRVAGGSNYLGRFQGVVDWNAYGGNDGGNPPGSIDVTLYGSLSGTNNWFVLTNHYFTTNWISLAVKTNGLSSFGSGIVNPGGATIFTMDHWELHQRTNYFDYQKIRINTQPSDAADIANKQYVDTMVANVKDGTFISYTDTNNVFHFVYNRNNFEVFDMFSAMTWVPMKGTSLSGTNMLIEAYSTNLVNGFTLQSSTNLALVNGFLPFTNYTTNASSGVTTFTIPLNMSETARFFRIISSSGSSSAFYGPVAFNGGTLYPSNTWSLATITNGMRNGDIITVNSNGLKLVDVWLSNSVPILKTRW